MSEFLKLPNGRIRKDQILAILLEDENKVAEFKFPWRILVAWSGGSTVWIHFNTWQERDKIGAELQAQMDAPVKTAPKKRKPRIIYG